MLPKFFKPDVNIYLIRVGSKRDGGYFIPQKIIKNIDKIISCGLGSDWSFEEDFKKKNNNVKIIFYDHSVHIWFWIKQSINSIYFFLRYGNSFRNIFKFIDYNYFFKRNNVEHKKYKISNKINFSKNEISLSKILDLEKYNLLLKIDIEGDEYKILNDIIKYQNKIDCLIIEFHGIKKNKKKIEKFLKKMKKLKNCNISPNNSSGFDKFNDPLTVEIILINKNYLKKKDFKKKINLKFLPNNPYKKNFTIKFKS